MSSDSCRYLIQHKKIMQELGSVLNRSHNINATTEIDVCRLVPSTLEWKGCPLLVEYSVKNNATWSVLINYRFLITCVALHTSLPSEQQAIGQELQKYFSIGLCDFVSSEMASINLASPWASKCTESGTASPW